MNWLWSGMIIFSLIVGAANGRLEQTVNAGFAGAGSAVEIVLGFAGIMCLWSGFLRLADVGGITAVLRRILRPAVRRLFPTLDPNGEEARSITVNMTANLLGMGNAATPAGIKAMHGLDRLNGNGEYASDEMCMLVVINSASIQLIPTTIISLRSALGSANAVEIILPVWICSICALAAGICTLKLMQHFGGVVLLRRRQHWNT